LAREYWGKGSILVILTAFSGLFAVYITGALGASRIIFALSRHGLLPRSWSQLVGCGRVPKRALHVVFSLVILGDLVLLLLLGNGLAAFNWWANALVFFAMLTFAAVNVANICFFRRSAVARFRILTNLVVPAIGAVSTLYVLYEMFFVALWSADWATGRSVVVFATSLFLLYVLVVVLIGKLAPHRLQGEAPIEAEPRPSAALDLSE
jgi:amino acid transporter